MHTQNRFAGHVFSGSPKLVLIACIVLIAVTADIVDIAVIALVASVALIALVVQASLNGL